MTRNTKREDRRALVEAGKRYHAAKLEHLYSPVFSFDTLDYDDAHAALVHAAEVYAVGRRKASTEYGHRHYARSKKAATLATATS